MNSNIDIKMDEFTKKLSELTNNSDLPISVIESIGTNWLNEVRTVKAMKLYQEREQTDSEGKDKD